MFTVPIISSQHILSAGARQHEHESATNQKPRNHRSPSGDVAAPGELLVAGSGERLQSSHLRQRCRLGWRRHPRRNGKRFGYAWFESVNLARDYIPWIGVSSEGSFAVWVEAFQKIRVNNAVNVLMTLSYPRCRWCLRYCYSCLNIHSMLAFLFLMCLTIYGSTFIHTCSVEH